MKSFSNVFGFRSAWTCKTEHLRTATELRVPLVRSRNHSYIDELEGTLLRTKFSVNDHQLE